MRKKIQFLVLSIATVCVLAFAFSGCGNGGDYREMLNSYGNSRVEIPEPTNNYVNDYARVFSNDEIDLLENALYKFDKTRGVEVLVITVDDLGDYSIADYAQQVGQKWGIGTEADDGVVIVVKPKNRTKGEAFITVGYGLEGIVPDATCRRIVSEKMIPYFQDDDYYGGVKAAVKAICKLVDEEWDY